ncbi:MAG: RsmE family RNA methyltransferase [Candidatus Dependentiae bacterium]
MTKHEFALYYPHLSDYNVTSGVITLTDKELTHRISSILRLQVNETVILFNKDIYVHLTLQAIARNRIDAIVNAIHKNKPIEPYITALIPLLKKDALETLFYHLVELGITCYQIVTTQKVQRSWQGEKEYQRLENIMIAAAEQSKNFFIPHSLGQPKPLSAVIEEYNSKPIQLTKIFFDVDGQRISELFPQLTQSNHFLITVGPEGDLTDAEKRLLKEHNFYTCRLTPTILRSWQAATIGIGTIRSFF